MAHTAAPAGWGRHLGTAAGVPAFSNGEADFVGTQHVFWHSERLCVRTTPPAEDGWHKTGIAWQCVEYARRFWLQRYQLCFGDVACAADMTQLTHAWHLPSHSAVPLHFFPCDAASAAEPGDLLIHAASTTLPGWSHGHVAVVLHAHKTGPWQLAEQNHPAQCWHSPHYARLFAPAHDTACSAVLGWLRPVWPAQSSCASAAR